MIKVSFKLEDGNLDLSIKGHAMSAKKGQDLICAAISAIAVGGLNALNGDYDIKLEEGFISVKGKIIKEDEIVIKTIITQIATVEEKYPRYVAIERK